MSKTKIGSNAQFTSAGKGLTVIGSHCYAYSGEVSVTNSLTTLLSFQTGKEYIVASWFSGFNETTGNDHEFRLYLNGIEVQAIIMADSSITYGRDLPVPCIIPPLSLVEIKCINLSSSGPKGMWTSLTGRVYG
jgi:hypothetical protein